MTPAEKRYAIAGQHMRVARARLLLQLADGRDDSHLADLLTFARQIGACSAADTLTAFQAAMHEELRAAQADRWAD